MGFRSARQLKIVNPTTNFKDIRDQLFFVFLSFGKDEKDSAIKPFHLVIGEPKMHRILRVVVVHLFQKEMLLSPMVSR